MSSSFFVLLLWGCGGGGLLVFFNERTKTCTLQYHLDCSLGGDSL